VDTRADLEYMRRVLERVSGHVPGPMSSVRSPFRPSEVRGPASVASLADIIRTADALASEARVA
jgi:hypothetical protein